MKKLINLICGCLCMILIWGINPIYASAAEAQECKGSGIGVDPLYANDPLVQEYLEIYEQSGGINTYASSDSVEKIFCSDIYEAGEYITEMARDRGAALQLSWIWEGDAEPEAADMIAEPYSAHQPYDTMSWYYWYDYEPVSDNNYLITYYIQFNYFTSDDQHQALLDVIDQAIEDLDLANKKDYEQAELIHDFICETCDYDYDALEDSESNPYTYTAYSALVNGKAVCMGYARAFTLMCERVGLSSAYISGTGNGGGHAWNIVKIGDYYYNVDCTWDGQGSSTYWYYFLKSTEDFDDHVRDTQYDTTEFHAEYPMSTSSFSKSIPLTGFSLSSTTTSVAAGAGIQLQITDVLPTNTTDSTKGIWSSSDSSVATVNADGLVVGVKEGSVVISCTIGDITRQCNVTVTGESVDTEFVIDANGVLTAYTGVKTNVIIPDSVKAIGSQAFYNNTNIVSVQIPDAVTEIGDKAFSGCTNLKEVNLPKSLVTLGSAAFTGCKKITALEIPKTLTGELYAFSGCGTDMKITFEAGTTSIADKLMWNADGIKEIVLPDGLTTIGESAFAYSNVRKVNIPASLTSTNVPFYRCNDLTDITFEVGITSIPEYLFYGCESLADVSIPDQVNSIGAYAFAYTAIKEITIPSGVTTARYAFQGCDSLAKMIFADGMETIPSAICYNCYGLSSVVIPGSVNEIQSYAFYNCDKLATITIPATVTYMGSNIFHECDAITLLVEPNSYAQTYAESNSLAYSGIKVDKSLELDAGETYQLTATYVSSTTTSVTWASSDTTVASVDANGLVTANAAGTATITCALGSGAEAQCLVTVKAKDEVTLNATEINNWTVGLKGRFAAYVNGKWVDPATMTWSSSNPEVATCEGGNIVGVGAGTTIISCTKENGTIATCKVTVKDVVTLNTTEINGWSIGLEGRFAAYVNGKWVDPATMTWSSSNPEVATCEGGNIVGIGAGTTVISCTKENGTVATCTVTVKGKDVVTLNATEINGWTIGLEGRFAAYVNGKWVDPATMTWSSSNPEVATCEEGNIVGIGAGTTVISCTKENGTVATCTVTVKGKDVVTLNATEINGWTIGLEGRFAAYVNGKWVDPATMTWSSSNPEVATCEGGNIVGVGVGTTVISCTKANGTVASCRVTVVQ